jgi:hypothetical protein
VFAPTPRTGQHRRLRPGGDGGAADVCPMSLA